jgi:hypothetical protein
MPWEESAQSAAESDGRGEITRDRGRPSGQERRSMYAVPGSADAAAAAMWWSWRWDEVASRRRRELPKRNGSMATWHKPRQAQALVLARGLSP